jgi:hypothetical protein
VCLDGLRVSDACVTSSERARERSQRITVALHMVWNRATGVGAVPCNCRAKPNTAHSAVPPSLLTPVQTNTASACRCFVAAGVARSLLPSWSPSCPWSPSSTTAAAACHSSAQHPHRTQQQQQQRDSRQPARAQALLAQTRRLSWVRCGLVFSSALVPCVPSRWRYVC